MRGSDPAGPVLLYDGRCALCAASVQFVLRHDRRGTLQFAPLDGAFGAEVLRGRPELAARNSMVWCEAADGAASEQFLTRSDAALRIARYLGGPWRLAAVATVVPRALRDALYRLVAAHRHLLLRGDPCCVLPAAEHAGRFRA